MERGERVEPGPGRPDEGRDEREPDPAVRPQEQRRDVALGAAAGHATCTTIQRPGDEADRDEHPEARDPDDPLGDPDEALARRLDPGRRVGPRSADEDDRERGADGERGPDEVGSEWDRRGEPAGELVSGDDRRRGQARSGRPPSDRPTRAAERRAALGGSRRRRVVSRSGSLAFPSGRRRGRRDRDMTSPDRVCRCHQTRATSRHPARRTDRRLRRRRLQHRSGRDRPAAPVRLDRARRGRRARRRPRGRSERPAWARLCRSGCRSTSRRSASSRPASGSASGSPRPGITNFETLGITHRDR